MPMQKRLLTASFALVFGLTGFGLSVFGVLPFIFLTLTTVSALAICYSFYVYVRQLGLLSFLPESVRYLLEKTSFFEILVHLFIYRRMSKTVIAIFSPFVSANSPQEAKQILK